MKILSAFGVIDIRRGDGTYVATRANKKLFDPLLFRLLVSGSDVAELVELRILVETGVVSLILNRLETDDSALREMEAAYGALAHCDAEHRGDAAMALPLDLAFHAAMGRATGNLLVENLYAFVIELLEPTMQPGHGLETHGALVDALKRRDEKAALAAIREHDVIWRGLTTG